MKDTSKLFEGMPRVESLGAETRGTDTLLTVGQNDAAVVLRADGKVEALLPHTVDTPEKQRAFVAGHVLMTVAHNPKLLRKAMNMAIREMSRRPMPPAN